MDVDRVVDAHPAGRRLDTSERRRREAVGGHHQPRGVDRTRLERTHVAADVGAVTGERHPAGVDAELEPSEAHDVSGRLEGDAATRRRQLQRPPLSPLEPGSGHHQGQAADDHDLAVLDELGDQRRDGPAVVDLADGERRRAHLPRA